MVDKFKKALLLSIGILSTSLYAREHVINVKNQESFFNKVQGVPHAVVLFYLEDKDDKDWHENIKMLLKEYKMVSDSPFYRGSRLRFIAVDIGKKGINDLEDEFGIRTVPSFVLFKSGIPVRNDANQIVVLSGFATQERIKEFIQKYLREDLEEQFRLEAERREELRDSYQGSLYFGVGYPYGYWGPYSPYYGWGYPYGYYGGYYGPGFGFGMSVPF